MTTYPIPGPPLYGSSSASSPAPPASASHHIDIFALCISRFLQSSAPPAPSSTGAAPPAQSSAAAGTVAEYGQCGGQGFTGDSGCVAPFTCTAVNGKCLLILHLITIIDYLHRRLLLSVPPGLRALLSETSRSEVHEVACLVPPLYRNPCFHSTPSYSYLLKSRPDRVR